MAVIWQEDYNRAQKILFYLFFGGLCHAACWIFVAWLGIEPRAPGSETLILTPGMPGNCPEKKFFF